MADIEPDDLILVAIVKQPRDLEIARLLGWYRIPTQFSPRTLHVDWLAFFQPASFGKEKWTIQFVARMRGFELVRRSDLFADSPDHIRANDTYFKIQLGKLHRLSEPVYARKWRRFTFLYTLGERLLTASDVNQLAIPNVEEKSRIWGKGGGHSKESNSKM